MSKKKKFLRFSDSKILVQLFVDYFRTGELHLQATCYVYVLWLRSILLKLPNLLLLVTSETSISPSLFSQLALTRLIAKSVR